MLAYLDDDDDVASPRVSPGTAATDTTHADAGPNTPSHVHHGREPRPLLAVTLGRPMEAMLASLAESGWRVRVAQDLSMARRLLQEGVYLLGLLACDRDDDSAFSAADTFLTSQRQTAMHWVGVFDRQSAARPACRELILDHLFDHHTLPVDTRHLAFTLGHAYGRAMLQRSTAIGPSAGSDSTIIGNSVPVKKLMRQLHRVARVDAPVLLTGESGSGKELAAQAVHRFSQRASGPFIAVNCGAIQSTLIQSALFGHVKGAFTGATRDEQGLIEAAAGGTIFLDEIGDLSLELQINLLRFLQERTITRVGSTRSIAVDARVVAATHVQLDKAVEAGTFRSDLFYRLNVHAAAAHRPAAR